MMLDQFRNQPGNRKLRLIAIACCNRLLSRITESHQQAFLAAITLAERFVEGQVTDEELIAAYVDAEFGPRIWEVTIANHSCNPEARWAARKAVVSVARFVSHRSLDGRSERRGELRLLSETVRCVLGNPFRPVEVDSTWLTSDVLLLAGGIYDERAFDRMPILADALQDTGCANDDVLNHCRGDGPHVRGCWVVDLLLGKG